ncbi:unnamed protein product [Urochloa humidicola]
MMEVILMTTVLNWNPVLPIAARNIYNYVSLLHYCTSNSLVDAHMMSIAWPYRKLKVNKASRSSLGTAERSTAGTYGRNAREVCLKPVGS